MKMTFISISCPGLQETEGTTTSTAALPAMPILTAEELLSPELQKYDG
jgi:hypothetical protein